MYSLTITKITVAILSLFLPVTDAHGRRPKCDKFAEELRERVDDSKKGDHEEVVELICDSSFHDQLRDEYANSIQGTPVLIKDTTKRCEGKRKDNKEGCHIFFGKLNENQKTKTECMKHDGCIFDEAKCRGGSTCENVNVSGLTDVEGSQICKNSGEKCHYEPSPQINNCIQKIAQDDYYKDPTVRNLLQQAFSDIDDCEEEVRKELSTAHRRLREGNNSPVLGYVALVLKANNWDKPITYSNIDQLIAQLYLKEQTVLEMYKMGLYYADWVYNDVLLAIEGNWHFANNNLIRGWSCDTYYPEWSNPVQYCIGATWESGNCHLKEVKASQPSNKVVKAICGGGDNHGFEIPTAAKQVQVYGVGHPSLRYKKLFEITENNINPLSRDGSQDAGIDMNLIEQDLSELEQQMSQLVQIGETHKISETFKEEMNVKDQGGF
jgi:hypothetical protein